jgi:predicted acetyltransferase
LIDVEAALGARRYAGEGRLTVDVTDAFLPANAGRYTISVAAGGTTSVARTDAAPDLALDVSDLATAYLGMVTFAELAAAGRVAECRPGALIAADALFRTDRRPWCSTAF